MSPRARCVILVAILGGAWLAAPAAGPPAPEGRPGEEGQLRDAHGDPLPPGAVARLGSLRLRGGATVAAFSPDSRLLASSPGNRTIALWDSASGKKVRQIAAPCAVQGLAFSPDGKALASGGEVLCLWEVSTGNEVRRLGGHNVLGVAFTPAGGLLASWGQDSAVHLWEAATGQEVRSLVGHEKDGAIAQVYFAPDGKTLASAGRDRTCRVWAVRSGEELHRYVGKNPSVRWPTYPTARRWPWGTSKGGRLAGPGHPQRSGSRARVGTWSSATCASRR